MADDLANTQWEDNRTGISSLELFWISENARSLLKSDCALTEIFPYIIVDVPFFLSGREIQ